MKNLSLCIELLIIFDRFQIKNNYYEKIIKKRDG